MSQQPQPQVEERKTEFVEISFDEDQSTKFNWGEFINEAKFYAIPIFSFVIFILIMAGAVIPNINKILTNLDEINVLKEKDKQIDEQIVRLIALREQNFQRQAIITKINEIVPTGQSEVVNFRERIVALAKSESLVTEGTKSGEVIIDPSTVDVAATKGLIVIAIPSEFIVTGRFESFREFLNSMYNGDDFFIVDSMTLGATPTDEDPLAWSASFNLAKYQFFADQEFDLNTLYSGIPDAEQPDQTVVNFLQNKFISLEPNGTDGSGLTPSPTPTVSQ